MTQDGRFCSYHSCTFLSPFLLVCGLCVGLHSLHTGPRLFEQTLASLALQQQGSVLFVHLASYVQEPQEQGDKRLVLSQPGRRSSALPGQALSASITGQAKGSQNAALSDTSLVHNRCGQCMILE